MVQPNPHLLDIQRDSDIIAGREGLVCLDRNERISAFSQAHFATMLDGFSPAMFSIYPDLGPLYERLRALTGLGLENLVVGAGSDGLIRRVFQAFISPGDTVVAPDPTYGMYAVWSRVHQADFQPVPYGEGPDFHFDIEDLIARVKGGARLCCIANPDQPTGSVLDLAALRRIAEACTAADALLLIDEAYYPFHDVTALPLTAEFENVLIVRTFSKVGGIAGLRVGYAMGAPHIVKALHAVRSPGEVNAAGAQVAVYLLDHPDVMADFCAAVEQGRSVLLDAAQTLGFSAPRCAGNFQLLKCPPDVTPDALLNALKERGYLIKGGFGHPGLCDYVRVTLDGPVIIDPFVEALTAAVGALREQNKQD